MPATTRTSETTQLAARLRLSVMRLARRLRQQAEGDVTPSMLSALASLERVGPSTLGELASLEHVQPPTMTRIVAPRSGSRATTATAAATARRIKKGMTPVTCIIASCTTSRSLLMRESKSPIFVLA